MNKKNFSIIGMALSYINIRASELYVQVKDELREFTKSNYNLDSWRALYDELYILMWDACELKKMLTFMNRAGGYNNKNELTDCIIGISDSCKFIGSLQALCSVYLEE